MRHTEQISRRIKLRHLNALLAVAECGSMAKAAQHLAVSQPVVSKAIADLEEIVGLTLLDRGPRGVQPTVYGTTLLKRSVVIFDELRTSVGELEHLADLTAGELRIGSTEAMANGLLPVIIDRLSRRYPRITFEVTLGDPGILQERELRGRRVDLIIGPRVTAGMADDLTGTVLYSDRLLIVAGTESPWLRRRKVVLADLVNERWCLPPPSHPVGAMVIEAFRRTGLRPPRSIVTAPSAPFTSCLISSGQFLGVLGSSFLQIHVPRRPLKVLPVRLPIAAQSIGVVTLKHRSMSPVAKLFIDGAREIVPSLAKFHNQPRRH